MDRNLYDPTSEDADPNAPAVEIEIIADAPATVAADGFEFGIEGEEGVVVDLDSAPSAFEANLAEEMSQNDLGVLASELLQMVDEDINSRKDWVEMFMKGLDVLGMKYEERTEPWAGACGVHSPLLNEAAIRFQSEMITETFPAAGPVKTLLIGEATPENEKAAERVREDMNYRLTEEMIEYRPEHERMLYALGLTGSAFKKVYKDPNLGRQTAALVPAEDLIMPYGASNVYTAERATHVMRKTKNAVKRLQAVGFYRNVDIGEPVHIKDEIEDKKAEEQGYTLNDDNRHQLLEIHVDWDLKGYEDPTGISLPYVITIDRGSSEVLAIRRNWIDGDPRHLKRQHFVQYDYVPGFGAYGMGFVHIIGGYARAGTSIIRQLVDAGTLSNLPGGLKSRGLRILGDDTPVGPGEFRDVDVPTGTVKDNIMTLPYKEPSQVLAGLLEKLTEDGRRLGAMADLKISDMSAQAPVGTTLALLERQLKVMSAVQARTHASLRMEFKLLKEIIRDEMPEDYSYVPAGGDAAAKQGDYDLVAVIPVSDPNAATMAQRIMQYQAAMQMSQQAAQIYDLQYLHRQMLEVLGIKNAEKIIPMPDEQQPRDPVSENMSFLTGKPAKAFLHQDHQAHIAVHMALLQDPMIMQALGPAGQQIAPAIMAHVAEHLAFSYRAKIEEMLGVPLTPPDAPLDPTTEVQLSRVVAQAAQQLLQKNVQQAQAAQAQAAQQDPKIAIEMGKIEVKKTEVQQREADSQRDYEIAQRKLAEEAKNREAADRREMFRVESQSRQNAERLAAQERQNDKRIRADVVKTVMKPAPSPGKPQRRGES